MYDRFIDCVRVRKLRRLLSGSISYIVLRSAAVAFRSVVLVKSRQQRSLLFDAAVVRLASESPLCLAHSLSLVTQCRHGPRSFFFSHHLLSSFSPPIRGDFQSCARPWAVCCCVVCACYCRFRWRILSRLAATTTTINNTTRGSISFCSVRARRRFSVRFRRDTGRETKSANPNQHIQNVQPQTLLIRKVPRVLGCNTDGRKLISLDYPFPFPSSSNNNKQLYHLRYLPPTTSFMWVRVLLN